ncbi:MAG: hypothetical protein ACRD3Q_02415, partial [Terriglobales bacterium]
MKSIGVQREDGQGNGQLWAVSNKPQPWFSSVFLCVLCGYRILPASGNNPENLGLLEAHSCSPNHSVGPATLPRAAPS